jgi:type I restriction enzyme S subunit
VPEHWQIGKFRHNFIESQEKIDNVVIGDMLSVSGYRGIEVKEYDDDNRRRLDEDLVGYRIVRPGQLVVNTMWLNYAGLGVSDFEGHVSPAYRSYWISEKFDRRFVHHLMRSEQYVKGYTKFLTGIRPNSLQMSRDDLMDFPILIPRPEEQSTIATFLDRETAKIDALVAEQQRLIELLKEKRQAVISHAVTKGLNPDAPMKDSGIEWLGDVPVHWGVKRLKFVATVQTGVAKGKDNTGKATMLVPYLRVANVQDGYLDLEDVTTIEIPLENLERYRLQAGDVLMNEGGDFDKLGRGHVWHCEIEPCIHQNHVFAVRPFSISSDWLNLVTGTNYAQFYFMTRSKQSTNLASISSTNVMELPVVFPPEAEQCAIAAFLYREAAKFDELTAEAQRGITLLQERRTALISAVVTGKIDVRATRLSEAA